MRVLLAFDKFKDAISAQEACDTAARALLCIHPDWTIDACPLTDGGDGFESIVGQAISAQPVALEVIGPQGGLITAGLSLARLSQFPAPLRAEWFTPLGLSPLSQIAIIEMARASGIARLLPEERNPWRTTTYGTGQLIRAAAELGAKAIVLGVGGSATNDVGVGALSALGMEFRGDHNENFRPPLPRHGRAITRIEGGVCESIPAIILATDVTNPLLGPAGATATYGPQKGLTPEVLPEMEAWVRHIAELLCGHCHVPLASAEAPGSGAAGGIAFGLVVAARARITPGFEFTAGCLDLFARIAAADLVITGEGRFDPSSLRGKGPGRVVTAATQAGKSVHVFAGQIEAEPGANVCLHALNPTGRADASLPQATRVDLAAVIQRTFCEPRFDLTQRGARSGAEPGKASSV